MSVAPEAPKTVFQKAEARYEEWLAGGQVGDAPELPVFRSPAHGVSAMMDPYSRHPYGVVVYPHAPAHDLWDLGPRQYVKVMLVAQHVGRRILDATRGLKGDSSTRALARVDGFAVPDHAHVVLHAGTRGAEPGEPLPRPELEVQWRQLLAPGYEHLKHDLDRVQ
jgi:hypothetical protein